MILIEIHNDQVHLLSPSMTWRCCADVLCQPSLMAMCNARIDLKQNGRPVSYCSKNWAVKVGRCAGLRRPNLAMRSTPKTCQAKKQRHFLTSKPSSVSKAEHSQVWFGSVRGLHWAGVAGMALAWWTRDLQGPWHAAPGKPGDRHDQRAQTFSASQ